ncbi:UNVERIFIED_CONTAM: hypothetical protein K2H54_007872 [Gekko kuhli]
MSMAKPQISRNPLHPYCLPLSMKMSGEEGHKPPASTAETTPVTTAIVPVSTLPPVSIFGGGTFLRHLYPVPYYTLPEQNQVTTWNNSTTMEHHFNVESMQETYLLTQGPRRESLFDMGTFQGFGGQTLGPRGAGEVTASQAWIMDCSKERKNYLLTEEDEEEDEVEQRLDALKRAQGKFHQHLEEVIQVFPDMVVRALQVERDAHQAPGQGAQQQAPGDQAD